MTSYDRVTVTSSVTLKLIQTISCTSSTEIKRVSRLVFRDHCNVLKDHLIPTRTLNEKKHFAAYDIITMTSSGHVMSSVT